ncbi:MAG: DoxX family protein [Actinomycetota bacterium]
MVVVASSLLALVLGLAFTSAGYAKVTDQPVMVRAREQLGVGATTFRAVGMAEMAGAVGVAIGLIDVFAWVGYVSAFGLLALMLTAIGVHLQAEDQPQELVPASVLALLAVAYLAIVAVG